MSSSEPPVYCRKEKSIGLLCSNFLSLYNQEGDGTIGLDDAAIKLGVGRRRMYDVVNILESVGIVARKGKNQYIWKGYEEIPRALEELKEKGLRENSNISGCCSSVEVSNNNENGVPSCLKCNWEDDSVTSSKSDNRSGKSLLILTQNFIRLFICSDVEMISLDDAAKALSGEKHDSAALRTKVRRLYDIMNVLSSMNLIEKTYLPKSRKPALRWLGWKAEPKNGSDAALDLNESNKRLFGTDITNYGSKRNKVDSSLNWNLNQKVNMPMHNRQVGLENVPDGTNLEHRSKHSSKGIVFGPFAPMSMPSLKDSEKKRVIEDQDNENLSSICYPQYHNQALSDVFAHYMDAWKSWFGEVSVKQQMQQTL
ncbi:E2F transcription factor-like E2FF isoform X1 [Fagus crenata]